MTAPQQQKLKITGPVVVTANRTTDGVVIYRTTDGWSADLAAAAVVTSARDAGVLLAAAVADDLGAVGPYVAPVVLGPDGRARPANLRERIRLIGPTVAPPGGVAVSTQ
jgi:hypothetical protein